MTRIRTVAVFALLALSLAACISVTNPQRLKETQTDDLCEMYYFSNRQAPAALDASWPNKKADIKKELDRRQAVASGEWPSIDQGRVEVGMSECALRAAWGFPERIDHTSTATGNSTHYVYSLARYADVVNGHVTTFKY